MKKKEKLMLKEEDQILKDTLAICLAKLIGLHYKYYKNKKFDTFDQYCDSYTCFTILSEKEINSCKNILNCNKNKKLKK